jgi:ATP-binding cassette subfamily B protein
MEAAPSGGGARRAAQGTRVRPAGLTIGAPEDAPAAAAADLAYVRRLAPYLRRHGALFLVALLLMPVAAGASLVLPLLVKRAVDAAVAGTDASVLGGIVLGFLGAISVEFVARFGQTYAMQLAGQRVVADLRRAVFAHVQGLRTSYFDRTPIGRIVTRVTNDVDALGELFASGAVTAIGDVLMLVGIVAFMVSLDWQLSLIAFAALPPLALVVEVLRRKARVAFRAHRATQRIPVGAGARDRDRAGVPA